MSQFNDIRAAAAAACLFVTLFATPGVALAQSEDGEPAATAPAAKTPLKGGPGSLDGLWNNTMFKDVRGEGREHGGATAPAFNDSNGKPIPMYDWIAKMVKERTAGWEEGKEYLPSAAACIPDGMPSAIGTSAQAPIRFVESPDQKQITVLYEFFSDYRIVKMDQPHSEHPTVSRMGESVGHWDGDTLVVDTIAVDDDTMIRNAIPHSFKLHLVERIRRTSADTLEDRMTIEDPMVFAKPFPAVARFKRVPGMRMGEFICTNNKHFVLQGDKK